MLISGEAEIYGAFPQKKLYIPVRHLRVLFQKQGNGTGYVRGGHAGAAFYSIAAGLIAAACDGSARGHDIRLADAGARGAAAGVVGHAVSHDIYFFVIIGAAYGNNLAADAGGGDGPVSWPHISGGYHNHKAGVPDFLHAPYQGGILAHVPAGEGANGDIDNADIIAVPVLKDGVQSGKNIRDIAAAPFVQYLYRNEVAAGRNTAEEAAAGAAVPADDATDMGAVAVVVIGKPAPPYHIEKGSNPSAVILMRKTAGIQHSYADAAPGRAGRAGSGNRKMCRGSLAHGKPRKLFWYYDIQRKRAR